jgi:hypothetical protein
MISQLVDQSIVNPNPKLKGFWHLDILKFSRGNTIVTFCDKYYEYGVDPDPDRRGLTIGDFESAFLANLEASYIFDKLDILMKRHMKFLGTYHEDKIIIFRGNRSDDWLHNWLKYFQKEVDRLLGTVDIQFTMEIWWPGLTTKALEELETTVPGIKSFNRININGNTSFPYLDIQLSWTEAGKLRFNIYKKPGELIKHLNTDSHHHMDHKMAVLQGVELLLALLTMVLDENKNLSLSEIYPDKHEALSIAGQIKTSEKMRTLREVLNDNFWSGPTRLEKWLCAINKRNSLFIVKYANLGQSNRPINQIIRSMRNEFKLKWLHPRVI